MLDIQQILISSGATTNQRLISLKQEIDLLGPKIDTLIDSTAKIIRRADHILSVLERRDYNVYMDQTGNTIHFKNRDTGTVETITAKDLNSLDPGSIQLIGTYERSMQINFNIFTEVYSEIELADAVTKAILKAQLRQIIDKMCSDLENIFEYLDSLGKQLHDHYVNIRFVCDKAKKELAVDSFT